MKYLAIILLAVAIPMVVAQQMQQSQQRQRGPGGSGGAPGERGPRGENALGGHGQDREQKLLDCLKKLGLSTLDALKTLRNALKREGAGRPGGLSPEQLRELLECLERAGISPEDAARALDAVAKDAKANGGRGGPGGDRAGAGGDRGKRLNDIINQGQEQEGEGSKKGVKN